MTFSTLFDSDRDAPCFRLKTGNDGCEALFQPARYLLTVYDGELCKRVELGYSGSRLLERLLHTPGEIVPREELLKYAWTERVVGQGSLNQQIYTLRQLLGDEQNRNIIQTLPRRGYLINPGALIITAPPELEAINPAATQNATWRLPRKPLPRWPGLLVATGALLLSGHLAGGKVSGLQRHDAFGNLQILYLAQTPKQLAQLRHLAEPAVASLAELALEPLAVTVSSTGEFVQMLCRDASRRQAHWLEVHQSRLGAVPDQDLRSCLL